MFSSSSLRTSSCLLCNKELDDQKPLILSSDNSVDSPTVDDDQFLRFKRSLLCFCGLLNVDAIYIKEILDRGLGDSSLMHDGVSRLTEERKDAILKNAVLDLPCCGECCEALNEISRLQEAINEMKTSQLNHVESLKSLLSVNHDGHVDENTWSEIGQQLIKCIFKRTTTVPSQLQPRLIPSSASNKLTQSSSRRIPNILRRRSIKSTLNSCNGVSTSDTSKTFLEYQFPANPTTSPPSSFSAATTTPTDEKFMEVSLSVLSFSSPPSNEKQQNLTKGRQKFKKKNSRQHQRPDPGPKSKKLGCSTQGKVIDIDNKNISIQPCSVVLKRLPFVHLLPMLPPPSDVENKNFDDTEETMDIESVNNGEEEENHDDLVNSLVYKNINDSNDVINRKNMGKSSTPKINYSGLFYVIDENTLLCQYTLIKVTDGGCKFSCMETGCLTGIYNPDWYALFDIMRNHVESEHMTNADNCKPCPIPNCPEKFPLKQRNNFRNHMSSKHWIEIVLCESCRKPIRQVSDNYRRHKWHHKNLQEQLETEEGPPKQLVYKAKLKLKMLMQKKKRKLGKMGKKLKSAAVDNCSSDRDPLSMEPLIIPSRRKKGTSLPTKKCFTNIKSSVVAIGEEDPLKEDETLNQCNDDNAPIALRRTRRTIKANSRYSEDSVEELNLNDDGNDSDDDNYEEYVPSPSSLVAADEEDNAAVEEEEAESEGGYNNDTDFTVLAPFKKSKLNNSESKATCGSSLSDKVWIVNEDTLLYLNTLIHVSCCGTQLKCLEPGCLASFQFLDYSALFDEIKMHIDSKHLAVTALAAKQNIKDEKPISRMCPFLSCQQQGEDKFNEGKLFRSHLLKTHSLDTIVCEICWKPIRNVSDLYRCHQWTHMNHQEKMDVAPPKSVVRKALISKKGKTRKYLEKLGVDMRAERNKKVLKPNGKVLESMSKVNEFFSKVNDSLLLYRFTLVKIDSTGRKTATCQEPGCGTKIEEPSFTTDYLDIMGRIREHVKSQHRNPCKTSRVCPLCNEQLESRYALRKHLLSKFAHGVTSSYICEICCRSLKQLGGLLHHMCTHKNAEERANCECTNCTTITVAEEYPCPTCGRVYNTLKKLKWHETVHLPKSMRKQYSCPQCPNMFLSSVAVRNHVERIHQPELKKFRYCPICNQQFNHREGYKFNLHKRMHQGERPFVCEKCPSAFTCGFRLKIHQRQVHGEVRMFQCEFCEMSYKHRGNLQRHRRQAHQDKVPTKDIEERLKLMQYEFRPDFIGPKIAYPCQFCDRVFALRSRMTKHVKLIHPFHRIDYSLVPGDPCT